ncbi:MAG: hypothetical protein MZV70_41810 [Desulfobacterales bacterium]|nr:hypothetical protein [Desulfobacterales bacterium]
MRLMPNTTAASAAPVIGRGRARGMVCESFCCGAVSWPHEPCWPAPAGRIGSTGRPGEPFGRRGRNRRHPDRAGSTAAGMPAAGREPDVSFGDQAVYRSSRTPARPRGSMPAWWASRSRCVRDRPR